MQPNAKIQSGLRNYPSIFNDVIGPVMRGPSSSHCAAAVRIGKIVRDIMDGDLKNILIEFDPKGSLATTHESQGSDMGLFGGFLGWDAADERLIHSGREVKKTGIKVNIKITPYNTDHPNTYKFTLKNQKEQHTVTALSTGGGMIEITEIDGFDLFMDGSYYETLIFVDSQGDRLLEYISKVFEADESKLLSNAGKQMLQIKAAKFPDEKIISDLHAQFKINSIKRINPVLPVLSGKNNAVPFITCEEMIAYNQDKNLPLWQLAAHYEQARGNLSEKEVLDRMRDMIRIMRNSIDTGLKGTEYKDRILGAQSLNFKKQMDKKFLVDSDILNRIILYVSAIMEVKSSMGVIVAAPTAGSCGALPGAVLAVAESLGLSEDQTVKAMLAAGMIGLFVSAHATFAAEVGGCQAECGSGAGMAAAAIVFMAGGSLQQSLSAASMALQNSLGMICDPIANRVEAPCLGKNTMAATNALTCANMALADYDPLIPLDEVIETMNKVGQSIPTELRCTALGGLSITTTSKRIETHLYKKNLKK